MKTLFLLDTLTGGGSEHKSVRLVNELTARGKCACLAYLNEPKTLLPKIDRLVPTAFLDRKGKFSFSALRNLDRFVEKHDISMIVCINLYPLLYAMALRVWPSKRSLRVVLAINTTEFQRLRDRFWMIIFQPLIQLSDAVIYGCEYQKRLWESRYRLQGVRSTVIYNGVDTNQFHPGKADEVLRRSLGLERNFVIGCIGRLAPEKNQEVLIRVVAELAARTANADLLIVGSGPEQPKLENLVSQLEIKQHVRFIGRLDDVRPALSAIDVFVLPSKSVETFSNAALEAMAMAVPVILSKVGGAAEMVTDNENGFLFETHDFSKLLSLVQQLMDDRKLCRRLGKAGRKIVLRRFTVEQMIGEYQSFLEDVG